MDKTSGHETNRVSVVIATYKGAKTLEYVLKGLTQQIFENFETIVVLKPSSDGTEDLLQRYGRQLNIVVLAQKSGGIVEAELAGLKYAKGEITIFLDDDAVPSSDCIIEHLEMYSDPTIGGISGDVIVSTFRDGIVEEIPEIEVPPSQSIRSSISARVWDSPLQGFEQYRFCITRCGSIWHGFWPWNNPVGNFAYWRKRGKVRSLLGTGANMSVLTCVAKDAIFDRRENWTKGYGWEQVLGWHIWKKGYTMIHNCNAKVHHIFTKGHLTGNLYALNLKKPPVKHVNLDEQSNFDILKERHLLFYRLYGKGKGLSITSKICSILIEMAFSLRSIKSRSDLKHMKILVQSNIMGLRWLVSSRKAM